jgi:GMP synthase-like glutamine amidotransferase
MLPIRIFRHVVCEGPGYLGEFLEGRGVPWELICLDDGIAVPMDLDRVSGLVFLGGNMSVNDPLHWIGRELALIRSAHAAGVPMMGVCFGGQLISKALGGSVSVSDRGMEIGWHPLRRAPACQGDDWLAGLPEEICTFHWHGETFVPPTGSQPLLANHCFSNQAFAFGDHLAMQFHLEMTEAMVEGWVKAYGQHLKPGADCIQRAEEITRDLPRRIAALHQVADVLYSNWLSRVQRQSSER